MSADRPWLLGLALAIGAGLALVTTMWPEALVAQPPLPAGAVARVDGELVGQAELDRAIAGLELDLGRELGPGEREEVREQLIDELLLVQHGLALELPQRDPLLRTQIARAVIDGLRAEVELAGPPSEAELRAHFEAERARFVRAGRVELAAVWAGPTRDDAARLRARWVVGAELEQLRALAEVRGGTEVPDAPLSVAKLADYVGPELARLASTLALGVPTIAAGEQGYWVVELRGRSEDRDPSFDELRAELARDLVRAKTDAALAALIDELRAAARIERGEP